MARRCTPVASRRTRTLVAGLVWSGVGVMLLAWAVSWLADATPAVAFAAGACGTALAIASWRVLFRGLAVRNLERLAAAAPRACVFGFQAPTSYAVTLAMIALGITLRHSTLPRPDLAVVYLAIGGALFLASITYHASVARSLTGVNR